MHFLSLFVSSSLAFLLASASHVARQSSSSSLTGGSICTTLMCITATVNGSTVEYVLQSKGSSTLGWMAIGFGMQMANTPMVILWPNTDGTVTLSQRMASGYVMPTVDASPPRVATSELSSSDLTGSTPKLAFSIPKNTDTVQNLIWAFGTTRPSSAVDATLEQHLDSGATTIDLTQPLSTSGSSTSAGSPASSSTSISSGSSGNISIPLLNYQRVIIAHGVLCVVGFLFMLPLGVYIARYMRTSTDAWFRSHWINQVLLSGPIIITGFVLGCVAVHQAGTPNSNDAHKKWGIVLLVLYFVQCSLGYIIHKFKPKSAATSRPIQNYGHAILGIVTIGVALYQVRTGYKVEWPQDTGRSALPKAADIVWIVWVVLLPVLYLAGLAFLPRQFRQERKRRQRRQDEHQQFKLESR